MARRRNISQGTIYKRPDGTWRAQTSFDGRRLSFSGKTKNECIIWMQTRQSDLKQGLDLKGADTKLSDFLGSWLDQIRSNLRLRTVEGYATLIRVHILPHLGGLKLMDLRPDIIDQFYATLLKKGVSRHAIHASHRVLHVALEKAVKYSYILRNPAHGAIVPKASAAEMSVLDEEQVSRFLTAAHTSRYEALFHLAVVTGMRQSELLGLKWADLSWNKGILYIRRQAMRRISDGFSEPKTKAGRRTVKLGNATLQMLQQQYHNQQLDRSLAGNRWNDNDLIFPSTIGTPLNQRNINREFHEILKVAGLPSVRFHDLRHTAASLMLNHGIPVIVVSKILGHSKPSVTLDIYGHLYNEMQDQAAKLMDDLVSPVQVSELNLKKISIG